jgi:WD40 repeat protein
MVSQSPRGGAGAKIELRIWDLITKRARSITEREFCYPTCIVFSPDGQRILCGCNAGVKAWDVSTGKLEWVFSSHVSRNGLRYDDWPVRSVALSHDGKKVIATGNGDGFVGGRPTPTSGIIMLDAASGAVLPDAALGKSWEGNVVFLPDGKTIAGVCRSGLHFWQTRAGKEVFTLTE